jgi:glycine/D-amino acid oxidase-like deaminating enzyme
MPAHLELGPKKNLRTGRSVWSAAAHVHPRICPLEKDIKTDIAIIGAGISGAFMAHALSRISDDVVVLDRREPGLGSTHASTAMLQFEIDTPLTELADKRGFDPARRAWLRSWRATQDLIALVRRENIVCGLGKRASLYLAGNEMGGRGLQKEARARRRIGLDCEFLSGKELRARFGIDRAAAIHSPGAAAADPVALSRGLLKIALRRGARLYSPVEVKQVMATRHGVVIDAGTHFIQARRLVFCMGYETVNGLPSRGTKITSSWAAATAPHTNYPGWLDKTLIWEAAKPYLYLRTTPDGRLIVGGEDAELDSPSYRADTPGRKAARLKQKTQTLFPGLELEWSHVWAGAFGESDDGLPIIAPVPDMPHCHAVMGFGGNGTIYAMIAAQMMPGLLAGRAPADADLFAFRE